MATKQDVYTFLDRVKAKAMKAITDKYTEDFDAAVTAYLQLPDNYRLATTIAKLQDVLDSADDYISEIDQEYCDGFYGAKKVSFDVRQYLFAIGWRPHISVPELVELDKQFDANKSRVAAEYEKIRKICSQKRDGDKAKEYLRTIGFDVTWLDQREAPAASASVDTSILFPCKETGA